MFLLYNRTFIIISINYYKLNNTYNQIKNKTNGKYLVFTKGGIDELLAICNSHIEDGIESNNFNEYRSRINEVNETMAKDGLRVITLANGKVPKKESYSEDDIKDLGIMAKAELFKFKLFTALATLEFKTFSITLAALCG